MSDYGVLFNCLVGVLRRAAPAVAAFLALAWSAPAAAVEDDVAATWQRASVALPRLAPDQRPVIGRLADGEVQRALASVPAGTRVPVVLLMHGCNGIGAEEESAKLFLMELGYGVFMPDSFARSGRQSNCAVATLTTALASGAPYLRVQEIDYALAALAKQHFVDRVFLIGYSEGGLAVANAERSPLPLAGIVVLSWHCQGHESFVGVKAPPEVPVLAIIGDNDPWYRARSGRHCGEVFAGRRDARSIVLPGGGHAIFGAPDLANAEGARAAILEFLRAR